MKKIQSKKNAPRQNAPKRADAKKAESPAALIDARIAALDDWRGEMLGQLRALIHQAVPGVVEEWKWRGTPVWSESGIICTGETYKAIVKLTFAKGAALADPAGLFNSSLDGNVRRAVDFHEGDKVNKTALKALFRAAATLNQASNSRKKGGKMASGTKADSGRKPAPVKLLSGGNPQIAKGDGDAPVQAYIEAMPGWKRDVGRRLDALIVRQVPKVQKAVKWNSPFYGLEGRGYFLSFHVFAKYVKVTFFRGTSLRPLPPGPSKHEDTRYADLREGELDEAQMAKWVKQAAALPGWTP
jgi:hypothetical protein